MKKVIWKDGKPYQEHSVVAPIDRTGGGEMRQLEQYRFGQADRKRGLPCRYNNGKYLDGWYNPDQKVPPFLTEAQVEAFNL